MSKKSSNVSSPSFDDENTLQILSLKGFTCIETDITEQTSKHLDIDRGYYITE